MSKNDSKTEYSNQLATDEELWAILRKVKESDEIPALLTSQFNEIWEYDYSNQGLNQRLKKLHQEGNVGHQKAAGRHMWWVPGEGTTEATKLSSLEELIDYEDLNPELFTKEKATEIAATAIPGFQKNWWQRVYRDGDGLFRIGAGMFGILMGILIGYPSALPDLALAFGLLISLALLSIGSLHWVVGYLGNFMVRHSSLSPEPWNGEGLFNLLLDRITPLKSKNKE